MPKPFLMALSQISFAELQVASLSFVSPGQAGAGVSHSWLSPAAARAEEKRPHGSLRAHARATIRAKIGQRRGTTQRRL